MAAPGILKVLQKLVKLTVQASESSQHWLNLQSLNRVSTKAQIIATNFLWEDFNKDVSFCMREMAVSCLVNWVHFCNKHLVTHLDHYWGVGLFLLPFCWMQPLQVTGFDSQSMAFSVGPLDFSGNQVSSTSGLPLWCHFLIGRRQKSHLAPDWLVNKIHNFSSETLQPGIIA